MLLLVAQIIGWLVLLILLIVLLILAYPLVEILIWRQLWLRRLRTTHSSVSTSSASDWSTALIYLSGISHFASPDLLRQQVTLFNELETELKPDRVIKVAFPYEAETAKEFHRFDLWRRLGWKSTPTIIFSLRNFEQAALANIFPNWYGKAVAECIAARLGNASAPKKLIVIGNSAGGSILLSAAPFLRQRWQTLQITAILCGGVYGSNRGFDHVAQFHQLLGSRDHWVDFGISITPSRRWEKGAIVKAKAEGRYHEHLIGDMAHFGTEGYYSDKYIGVTSAAISTIAKQ